MERVVYFGNTKSNSIWTQNTWTALVKEQKHVSSPDGQKGIPLACFKFSGISAADASQSAFPYGFAVLDQRGYIFFVDFEKNRFQQVARCGISGSCMAFNPKRKKELVIALSNRNVQVYNTETGNLVAKLPTFHRSEAYAISFHPQQDLVLTTSQDEAILWNSNTWERQRTLFGDVGIQQASFSPDGQYVIAAFQDATIIFWNYLDYTMHWKIQINPTDQPLTKDDAKDFLSYPREAFFAVSPDSEILVYGGFKSNVFVWNIKEKRLLHEIVIPSIKTGLITDLQFIDTRSNFSLLTSSGQILFIDAVNGTFIGQLQSPFVILSFKISPDFKLLAVHHSKSKNQVSIYFLDSFTKDAEDQVLLEKENHLHATPPPIEEKPVKAVQMLEKPKQQILVDMIVNQPNSNFDRVSLRGFLKKYKQFPDKHRTLIWRCLLQIPENMESYNALMGKGKHLAWKSLRDEYPMKQEGLFKSLERVLSALTFWSPIFGDLEYLPAIIFPFIKVFQFDLFSSFEVVMSVLINWCQGWWDYFPNPPIEVLNGFNELLGYFEPDLFNHFSKNGFSSQIFAWLPLKSFFADNFTKQEWCVLFDNILCNHPSFLYYCLLSFISLGKASIMKMTKKDQLSEFYRHPSAINVYELVELAYKFYKNVPEGYLLSPKYGFIQKFQPVSRGVYPVFSKYPEFVVNYKQQMREKIQKEEEEYMRQRKVQFEMNKLHDELLRDKKLWGMLDWTVDDVLDKWWDSMQADHEQLLSKKASIHAKIAQDKTVSMRQVADARKAFIESQLQNTLHHINSVTKTMDANRKQFESDLKQEMLDRQVDSLQNEWDQRKKELVDARKEIDVREKKRLERLLRSANVISYKKQDLETELKNLNLD